MRGPATREVLGYPAWQWWMLAAVCVVVAIVVYMAPPARPNHTVNARMNCEMAIKASAKNPSAAKIPHVRNQGAGGEFYFAWPHGSGLRLQNGFGAMIDTSAACTVSANGRTVTSLSINGETII